VKWLQSFFLHKNYFYIAGSLVLLFVVSFFVPLLYIIARVLLFSLIVLSLLDILLLYSRKAGMHAERDMLDKLSNGDQNPIHIHVKNLYFFPVRVRVIDELPFQFQKRDFCLHTNIAAESRQALSYLLRPVERGAYLFGALHVYTSSPLRIITRRYTFAQNQQVPVYPSLIQLKKYDIFAISHRLKELGVKKIRKIGTSMEFDQIRSYVQGDDFRKINWKATARKNEIMIDQFRDERCQHVYSVIDMGRVMKMPFEGMTLLDYAINAGLVISNVAIRREDKAGVVTFSDKIDSFLPADKKYTQMFHILETLYACQTAFMESNYEALYTALSRKCSQRSLILLFTNYDTLSSLKRNIGYLSMLARRHFLVILFFENTEITGLVRKKAASMEEIYVQTIAEKFLFEKRQIIKELQQYGIQAILTTPQKLTIDTINKYIELKSRGII
jgi:uncharacterized protein (DUF58 family)